MKKILTLTGAFVLSMSMTSAVRAADTYTLDPTHTAVTWHISHFGFSKPSGKFMDIQGAITLDRQDPAQSKVEATIPVKALLTGVPKLDEHLMSQDFFNVASYPTAHFVSTQVRVTGKEMADVTGDLTLLGVTKKVTLHVQLNKQGDNFKGVKTVGFSATTTLKRSEFGMTTYLPGLGDDVALDIESEGNLVP